MHHSLITATSLLHLGNGRLNLAVVIGSLFGSVTHHLAAGHSWRAQKASSYALSAASETLVTNPKAEGWRSSPISPRCKESVPDSSGCRDLSCIWLRHKSYLPVRAINSTVTQGWQSTQILCSLSFFVQRLCYSLFPCILAKGWNV